MEKQQKGNECGTAKQPKRDEKTAETRKNQGEKRKYCEDYLKKRDGSGLAVDIGWEKT